MDLYNYLTEATTDEEYVPITETFSELYKKQQKLEGISFLCQEKRNYCFFYSYLQVDPVHLTGSYTTPKNIISLVL